MNPELLVPGVFALAGAILGALLSGWIGYVVQRRRSRDERVRAALRSVAIALAAQDFAWSVGVSGAPPGFPPADRARMEREAYIRGVERYLEALHAARRDIAVLRADGLQVGEDWRTDRDFSGALEDVYEHLLSMR